MPFDEQTVSPPHGYRYAFSDDRGWTEISGGFESKEEAAHAFATIVGHLFMDGRLPQPRRRWQFWKDDPEMPSLDRHVY